VMGLRLIRRNCTYCNQPYQPEPALLRLVPPEVVTEGVFQRGTGCPQCLNTGFAGRKALTELLVVDEVFRDAVLQKLPTRTLHDVAVRQGMQTLWQNGLKRVLNGETPLEEILRVIAVDQL